MKRTPIGNRPGMTENEQPEREEREEEPEAAVLPAREVMPLITGGEPSGADDERRDRDEMR